MSLLNTFLGFAIAAFLTAFAVLNRHHIEIFVSPWHPALDAPFYLVALGFAGAGFILGGVFVWLNGGSVRRISRKQRKTIKTLEKELQQFKTQDDKAAPDKKSLFPSLPGPENSPV